jgi:hypothetical protein
MEGLLKTYATRLARKTVLQQVGLPGLEVLKTEEHLLEMALSRLREELLGMRERPKDSTVADMVRREASMLVERYADDEGIRLAARTEVESLSDNDILPRLH